jgi:hypothetical protein
MTTFATDYLPTICECPDGQVSEPPLDSKAAFGIAALIAAGTASAKAGINPP